MADKVPRRLLDSADIRRLPPGLYRLWVLTLTVACDYGGKLPLTEDDLAAEIRGGKAAVGDMLERMTSLGYIHPDGQGYEITGWMTPEETAAEKHRERQRRYRLRQKSVTCDVTNDVTCDVTNDVTCDGKSQNYACIIHTSASDSNNNLDNKGIAPAASNEATPSLWQQIVDAYHELCPDLPRVRAQTPARQKAARQLVKSMGLDKVKEMLKLAGQSDFLAGKNDRGWRADLTWLLNPTNAVKVLEDRYSNHAPQPSANAPNRFHNFEQRKIDYDALLADEIGLKKRKKAGGKMT